MSDIPATAFQVGQRVRGLDGPFTPDIAGHEGVIETASATFGREYYDVRFDQPVVSTPFEDKTLAHAIRADELELV